MNKESQQSISQWSVETFGREGSDLSVALRANEEMAELLSALRIDESNAEAIHECADVAIVLYRLADRLRMNISYSVNYISHEPNMAFAIYANKFLSDIICMIQNNNLFRIDILFECIYSNLMLLCERLGCSLQQAVDEKMEINRNRDWSTRGR